MKEYILSKYEKYLFNGHKTVNVKKTPATKVNSKRVIVPRFKKGLCDS